MIACIERFRLWPRWRRISVGTLTMMIVFLLASLLPLTADCISWETPGAASFYMQTSLSAVTLATWYIFLIGGYLYSSIVIAAVSEWKTDIRRPISILLYGTVIYWVGPVFVLNAHTCEPQFRDASSILFNNFVCWGLVQMFAQWFTLLDDVPALNKIMFTREAIRKFGFIQWGVTLGAVVLILGLIIWQWVLLFSLGRFFSYLGILVGVLLLMAGAIKLASRTHYFHFHHYALGGLVPFFPVPHVVSTIAQAILVGICIEGLSRWGPDPWFKPHDDHVDVFPLTVKISSSSSSSSSSLSSDATTFVVPATTPAADDPQTYYTQNGEKMNEKMDNKHHDSNKSNLHGIGSGSNGGKRIDEWGQ